MELITDIADGKLIATGRGGNKPGTPWATVIFDVKTDALIDVKWYATENEAKAEHYRILRGVN